MRTLVSSIAVAGVGLLVARAGATSPASHTPGWQVEWQAPAECPPRERFVAQVDRILGSGGPPRAPLTVRALVTHPEGRWHLALSMTSGDRTSQRDLDAESCGAVAAAAAVIVALTIEARGSDTGDAGSPGESASIVDAARSDSQAEATDAGASQVEAEALVADPDVPKASPLPFFVLASALGSVGELPRPGLGLGGALGFAGGPLLVEATIAYWPEVSHALPSTPSGGGTFRSAAAGLRGCGMHPWAAVSVGMCAGGSLTWMHAEAFGVTTPIAAGGTWPSLRGDALIRGAITRVVSLRASLGGVVPLARPTFDVDGLGVVYRPPALALELGAGVEAHF